MKKRSYMARLLLLAALSASALVSLPRAGAQTGLEQTPIDIRNEDSTFDPNLPALGFSYSTKAALSVVNTGSPGEFNTVRAELPGESNNQLTVAGVNYRLLQFHWHTPSEHELNGRKFPLEMHLVHKFDDGTPAGVLSVVGVFVRAGRENAELAKIFSHLPAEKDERRTVARFNLTKLLPDGLESYRYDGSLTTPNASGVFLEGVKWIVLAEPIEMSAQQIEAFKRLFPEGNSREVQPLNGRTIKTDVEPLEN
ncbi:MAG TPA: carbonic anhydrase family protein [Pyrinomonadaceae bacterium]|nr:carbonic anhydrase family protein [Pyrinomonadaceae bacterium]